MTFVNNIRYVDITLIFFTHSVFWSLLMVRYAQQKPPPPLQHPPFVTRLWSQCPSIVSQMEGSAEPPTGCLHTLLSPASTRCHLPLAYSTAYVIVFSIIVSSVCSTAYSFMYCIVYSIAIDTTIHHSFSSKYYHLCLLELWN